MCFAAQGGLGIQIAHWLQTSACSLLWSLRLHTRRALFAEWLVGSHGRIVMTLLAVFPVLPMCLLTRMRSVRNSLAVSCAKPLHCVDFLLHRHLWLLISISHVQSMALMHAAVSDAHAQE